ncbi:3-dehydroquinate synthase [Neptuniibacter sp. 1_MG-2023]|jgi:3-dehydroquinate synthase|uniref:3-dehydroquinate synthase n=1 Tax=Neptuniibacter sp. 1_MG-2023 TaxID=3062662 RepID=UPI0026E41D0C|nr:3-dehydroquinate synthase [Neptuniibacter sp. 1_MG-2023]MDO6593207.1 3-dehydroquinate synthase [Neptuniibacter sp. 1_MG-2023]
MQTLKVDLGERSYPIFIGQGLLDKGLMVPYISGKQVLIVTNETIAPLYLERLKATLNKKFQVDEVILPDGEQYKNLEQINSIFTALLDKRHNRTTTLIALGGGVIGDMTGFAAACYQRGVDFIQVPTTLLSQVDSSVGGKTGVNHPQGKNMIGAFHQPQCVVIDTDVLNTLPEKELSAGMAEVIKYGLIYDEAFLCYLEDHIDGLMGLQSDLLEQAILRSCEIKAEVVALDEREEGIRALLNLGHTFGHAIEADQGYGEWLHGEAVGAGTMMAADMSFRLGNISATDVARVKAILEAANLPLYPPEAMTPERFVELMGVDKKVIDGSIRLVLLKEIGKAVVTSDFSSSILLETLSAGKKLATCC